MRSFANLGFCLLLFLTKKEMLFFSGLVILPVPLSYFPAHFFLPRLTGLVAFAIFLCFWLQVLAVFFCCFAFEISVSARLEIKPPFLNVLWFCLFFLELDNRVFRVGDFLKHKHLTGFKANWRIMLTLWIFLWNLDADALSFFHLVKIFEGFDCVGNSGRS